MKEEIANIYFNSKQQENKLNWIEAREELKLKNKDIHFIKEMYVKCIVVNKNSKIRSKSKLRST